MGRVSNLLLSFDNASCTIVDAILSNYEDNLAINY